MCLKICFVLLDKKRGGCRYPTIEQFEVAFKQILINSLMKVNTNNSNCEADNNFILQELNTYSKYRLAFNESSVETANTV